MSLARGMMERLTAFAGAILIKVDICVDYEMTSVESYRRVLYCWALAPESQSSKANLQQQGTAQAEVGKCQQTRA